MPPLANHRILVVEDEALIAFEVGEAIREAGGSVAGPFATAGEALWLIENENITAAVLDLQLWGETSVPIARRLLDKSIPFLYYTANASSIEPHLAAQILEKPATPEELVSALAALIAKSPRSLH
ncbi:MAG TPA: response regulator [Methylocella sp.]|nr:response regulator [Methylocella sp.]